MGIDVILGLQWGDEGKGKIVDYLAKNYDIVCRFQGGPNAGHTIKIGDAKYVLHTIPSGIFRAHILNLIGNGVVIDPITFVKEVRNLEKADLPFHDRLLIAKKAHLIIPTHRYLDAASEAAKGSKKIGSTLKGIGPTYMDKTGRNGLRVGDILRDDFKKRYAALKEKHMQLLKMYPAIDFDLETEEKKWFENIEILKKFQFVNGEYLLNKALKEGKRILAEGAQGSMLDIDHGTYPFVTSSNTITAGVCSGLGVAPNVIGEVIGIAKAYCTRVGSGPFPSELFDVDGERLGEIGQEFGATTGRSRRCGWIDIPQLKYTIMINGVTQICLTKLDVLNTFEQIKVGKTYTYDGKITQELPYDLNETQISMNYESFSGWGETTENIDVFESLPARAQEYVKLLESYLEVKISMVSVGPKRKELIIR